MVAQQYKSQPETFAKTARLWTASYAGGKAKTSSEDQANIEQLMTMGFDVDTARNALSSKNWNMAAAIDFLCS